MGVWKIAKSDYRRRRVCLSVCLSAWKANGFSCNLIFEYFSNNCQDNSNFIKIRQE